MTKIKICGLTRPEDVRAVNGARPDYAGFVFWPRSRRAVDAAAATALRRALDPDIPAVGVFVDQPLEEIAALLRDRTIDIAQLHGHETPEDICALQRLGRPVWKAFKVRSPEDVRAAEESPADLVLLDNGYGTDGHKDPDKIMAAVAAVRSEHI